MHYGSSSLHGGRGRIVARALGAKFPHLLSAATLMLLVGPVWATGYMGSVRFDYQNPSHLQNRMHAGVIFDYKITEPAGAKFGIEPYFQGSPVSDYNWGGSDLHPLGTGTETNWFTFLSGVHSVDQVRIMMTETDGDVLMDLFVSVDYRFEDHGIYNLDFYVEPLYCSSPSWFGRGQRATIGFDYSSNWTGTVKIFARPFTNGSLTPGYSASGSASLPPAGHAEQWFTFDTVDADVTHVRFQMQRADNGQVLLEFFVPVDLHWRAHGASNFSTVPQSPEALPVGEVVRVDFDYATASANGVRIWAHAASDNHVLAGQYFYASPILTDPTGHVTRGFWFAEGDHEANQFHILMTDAVTNEVLFEQYLPAEFRWAPSVVNSICFLPGPPAVFGDGEFAQVTFHYVNGSGGPIKAWAIPFLFGERNGTYTSGDWLSPGEGDLDRYFAVVGEPGVVNRVLFHLEDQSGQFLLDIFREGWFFFGRSGNPAYVPASDHAGLPAITLGQNTPNPFSGTTLLPVRLERQARVRVQVFDVAGRLVRTLHDDVLPLGVTLIPLSAEGLPAGVYFARIEVDGKDETRRIQLVK